MKATKWKTIKWDDFKYIASMGTSCWTGVAIMESDPHGEFVKVTRFYSDDDGMVRIKPIVKRWLQASDNGDEYTFKYRGWEYSLSDFMVRQ